MRRRPRRRSRSPAPALLDDLRRQLGAGRPARPQQRSHRGQGAGHDRAGAVQRHWVEAGQQVGETVCAGDLARTPAQRRADALVELARRAIAVAVGARMPEPLFSVLVGYETFTGRICEPANRQVVAPGDLARWLGEAWWSGSYSTGSADVGVRRRIFAGVIRRAVELRDRECFHDDCDEPAEGCQIDHVVGSPAG